MKRPPAIDTAVEYGLAPFRGKRAAGLLPQARLGGAMPWVLAIMVLLTLVASAGALALGNVVAQVQCDLVDVATVQIVEPDAARRAAKIDAAVTLLRGDPAIDTVTVVPDADIAALLEPWLGNTDGAESLPLPALIDVTLSSDARLDAAGNPEALARIDAQLRRDVPGARIDTQARWLAPVTTSLRTLSWMALGLVALLAAVSAAAVWLAARNALAANADTVEIVHLLGGDDRQIARIFQRSVLLDAVVGGIAGSLAGVAVIAVLQRQFAALQSGMVAGGSLSTLDWLTIALVPLFAVAIAVYTARMTVLSHLRKTL